MAWVRLEDQFPDHPKVVSVGPLAAWLYVAGLCYCNRMLTNGFIPISQLARLVPSECQVHAKTLCDAGLWTEINRRDVPGFFIHDYLKYQPSKKMVEKKRALTAGRQGRYRNGRNANSNASRNAGSNGVSNASSNASSNAPSNALVTLLPNPIPIPTQEEKKDLNQKDLANNQQRGNPYIPRSKNALAEDERFARFWAIYPNKKAKDDARKAWHKRQPSEQLTDLIVRAVEAQMRWFEWTKEGGKFIPYPATWLNRGAWDDEPNTQRGAAVSDTTHDNLAARQALLQRVQGESA